jgi:hypothetical protein
MATEVPSVTGDDNRYANEIRERTRRRIEIFSDAGEDWRFAASLKSISTAIPRSF